jgi:hypothetical protein
MDGETTIEALAASTGLNQAALTTILRLGIAYRVFKEPRPGVIAHSAASRLIAEDPRLASWVATATDDMWPAAGKVVDALAKWPMAAEPNQTVCISTMTESCRLVADIQRDSHWQTTPTCLSTTC